ncbi:glycosyltransferase family 4 protein [Synechococcus sp. PCC 7336]|uniref:glycosyltransferase family 4 protein n=1 Tax=Synechococcus sp. PCC 7336 TaxID=195250 RepID=UPI0003481512|nr:glycosyltransferase [Synechococcus sp. PCC 7336]
MLGLSAKLSASPVSTTHRKLLIVSPYTHSLGGMTVSLSLLIEGFKQLGLGDRLRVATRLGSLQERYLVAAGHADCLQPLVATGSGASFLRMAMQWVHQQPHSWPLLLDNCVWRDYPPILIRESLFLHLHRRPVFHFFHDLALSYNRLGNWARKLAFTCLSPGAICNSHFTASHIRQNFMREIRGILYQPVDTDRFSPRRDRLPPDALRPLLDSGTPILLTPSRLNKPGIVNDKNLRALMPVLAALKARGERYHSVVIGDDGSNDGSYTRDLEAISRQQGVADCLTLLPSVFDIECYFPFAEAVVALAPREPFGRTVVEAIASGVPAIGSNTGGIAEILNNFAPAWTASPDDPRGVADRILSLRTSPAETDRRLQIGQAWIAQHCQVTQYAKGVMELTGLVSRSSDTDTNHPPDFAHNATRNFNASG